MGTVPLVTVLVAVRDGEAYLRTALASILGQTVSDLELVVVDDASTDATPELLEAEADARLRVIRNEEQLGLAGSLNRGLDETRGTYVARLDADDVAMPRRLERQLARIRMSPRVGVVGSAVLELDASGRVGPLHAMPAGAAAVRWAALFSSPFLHPTVLVEREVLDRNALRYDASFEESEDHELWSRVLDVSEGDNLPDALVLYRVHSHQASQRRRGLQRAYQVRVGRRAIERIAPTLSEAGVELAWQIGAGEPMEAALVETGVDAYLELVTAFESRWGRGGRERAARDVMRAASDASPAARARIVGHALRLDPGLPLHIASRRRERRRAMPARREGEDWLHRLAHGDAPRPIRVAAVFPEPTPYRAPLLDRVAAHPEVDLTVVYAAETVAGRTWRVEPTHRAVYLRGLRLPGAERILHHDYPVTPGVVGALSAARPAVVVVSGWSTFAAQAAIAWCGLKDVPYVLVVESHDDGPRSGWRRTVKGTVVPPVVQRAAGILVTGTLARTSMIARGAAPERVHLFANTVDIDDFGARADGLRVQRPQLRDSLGARAGRRGGAVRRPTRAGEENRCPRAGGRQRERPEPPPRRGGRRAGTGGNRAARRRGRRSTGARRRRRLGSSGRAVRGRGRVRAVVGARDVGRSGERSGGVRSPARSLRPSRCGARPSPRR